MNADVVRTLQHKLNKQNFDKVIETHMGQINTVIDFHKQDKECIYTFDNFIPGIPIYNNSIVLKHIAKQLQKEGYGVERVSKNKLKISWRLSNRDQLKEYVQTLIGSVYESIKRAVIQNKVSIVFEIPKNIRYHPQHVQYYLKGILIKKKFTVNIIKDGTLLVSW